MRLAAIRVVLLVMLTRARVALGSLTLAGSKTKEAAAGRLKTGVNYAFSLFLSRFRYWFLSRFLSLSLSRARRSCRSLSVVRGKVNTSS